MSQQPDLTTLPERMRYAASVINAVNRRASDLQQMPPIDREWNSSSLHRWADAWEVEDDVPVGELAEELLKAQRLAYPAREDLHTNSKAGENARILAAHLIESGWRKGGPA